MKKIIAISVLTSAVVGVGCSTNTSKNSSTDTVYQTNKAPAPDPAATVEELKRDKKKRERPDADPSATPEPSSPKPAPENSEASVMMNSDGSITEIRVFKDHPQIAKAEATWTDPMSKSLKVTLKSGKVMQAKTDKVPTLASAPSADLLRIVGGKSSQTTGDRPRVVDDK